MFKSEFYVYFLVAVHWLWDSTVKKSAYLVGDRVKIGYLPRWNYGGEELSVIWSNKVVCFVLETFIGKSLVCSLLDIHMHMTKNIFIPSFQIILKELQLSC